MDATAPHLSAWVRRLALAGVLLGFVVVVLGAYVRLTAAGLGCPDWPGCYGHVTPLGAADEQAAALQAAFPGAALDLGKAWREMIHRYAATTLGFISVLIAALGIATRRQRVVPLGLALGLLAVIVFQGLLGMLTVTWLLKPLIVTCHLIFGLSTLAMFWWLWLTLTLAAPRRSAPTGQGSGPRRLALIGLAVLGLQIALGGWTSSNYAATACPDFPTCQGRWLPEMSYRNAFVLWHGLGSHDAGGVLDNPARIAIHFTHRAGALLATLALLAAAGLTLRRRGAGSLASRDFASWAAVAVLTALALQLALGTFMVLRGFPLAVASAHNAGAALLVLAVVALNRSLRPVGVPARHGETRGGPGFGAGPGRGSDDSANLRLPLTKPLAEAAAQH
jgi:cytochrome c oxidase assembly protein subunit 15